MKSVIITGKDYFYWILMLVAIIVFLFTYKFGDSNVVVNYFSFAGTLISIILALVAIIYSFFQSYTFSSVNDQISKTSEKTSEITDSLTKAIINYKNDSNEVLKKMDNFTNSFDKIFEERLENTNNHLCSISQRLEEYAPKADNVKSDVESIIEDKLIDDEKVITDDQLEGYFNITSQLGTYVCFSVFMIYNKGIKVNIKDFFTKLGFDNDNARYCFGYYISMLALKLVKSERYDDSETITYVHPFIEKNVSNYVDIIEAKNDFSYRKKIIEVLESIPKNM